MNIWVCQYILKCVDGDVVQLPGYTMFSLLFFLTGVLTLLSVVFEPGDGGKTPLVITALFSTMVSALIVLAIVLVVAVASNLTLNFGLLLVIGASIISFILIVLSAIIRNKKWK